MRRSGSPNKSLRAGLILAALIPLAAGSASADEIHRWVDANGDVHYSNRPADSGKGAALPAKTPERAVVQVKSVGPAYSGSRPSRPIRLEEAIVRLEVDGEEVVGHVGSGPRCEPRKQFIAKQGREFVAPMNLPARFAEHARKRGYQVATDAAVPPGRDAGLRVFASVKSLEVKECEPFGHRKNGQFVNVRRRHYLQLAVDWELFDGRRLAARWASTGRFSDLGGKGGSTLDSAFVAAFLESTDRMFQAPAIASVLAGEGSGGLAAPPPAKLEVAWSGPQPAQFRARIKSLEAATVTIRTSDGHGSGFLISKAGHVLTNWHVVRGQSRATAVFASGEIPAKIVGGDPKRDVALLLLERPPAVAPLTLSSVPVGTGDTIYLIGTPLDESLSHSVSRGILSAEREFGGQRLYQTDAAANPGNSGGPALNERGDVIGLTVSGAVTDSGAPVNIAFLIPIDDAMRALGYPKPRAAR